MQSGERAAGSKHAFSTMHVRLRLLMSVDPATNGLVTHDSACVCQGDSQSGAPPQLTTSPSVACLRTPMTPTTPDSLKAVTFTTAGLQTCVLQPAAKSCMDRCMHAAGEAGSHVVVDSSEPTPPGSLRVDYRRTNSARKLPGGESNALLHDRLSRELESRCLMSESGTAVQHLDGPSIGRSPIVNFRRTPARAPSSCRLSEALHPARQLDPVSFQDCATTPDRPIITTCLATACSHGCCCADAARMLLHGCCMHTVHRRQSGANALRHQSLRCRRSVG